MHLKIEAAWRDHLKTGALIPSNVLLCRSALIFPHLPTAWSPSRLCASVVSSIPHALSFLLWLLYLSPLTRSSIQLKSKQTEGPNSPSFDAPPSQRLPSLPPYVLSFSMQLWSLAAAPPCSPPIQSAFCTLDVEPSDPRNWICLPFLIR